MDERPRPHGIFWTMFIGFNLGFFPMHISGLLGMPRRIYTYSATMGWDFGSTSSPPSGIGRCSSIGVLIVPSTT